ncbi:MAG: tetratricopeptide repeat protein [Verrucomicrobia bacterium]|nr:MAG: tetratricopeptide repeat protein [Verrucomicrobiota bacterium]
MAAENPSTGRKHRVIDWKPSDATVDSSAEKRLPRWVVGLLAAGGILLIAVALLGGFVIYRISQMQQRTAAATAVDSLSANEGLRAAFVSRSRAEFAREAAMKGLETIRKTPSSHPALMNRLIEIERAVYAADKSFGDANYGLAVQQYEAVTDETREFAAMLEDMRIAREKYDEFLVEIARLERLRALAPALYEDALTQAGAARTFLDEGSFSLAREKIEEAHKTLDGLEKSVEMALERALADGRAALARGDGPAAEAAFKRALEMQPDNEYALASLERAKNIGRVFELLDIARGREETGDLEGAKAAYEKAFALDGKSAAAQAGIARMKAAIKKRDFDAALARAETAKTQGNWDQVIAAYNDALEIEPDNEDLKLQLAEARVRQREAYIESTLAKAYEFEKQHQWEAARRLYLGLIDFEPDQKEAAEGLLRTGKVLRALLKFEKLLEDARSHAQRANFQAAIASFNEAMANKPAYLALTPEQIQLKEYLEAQSRPVPVRLVSDNKTYVTIMGVRLLGRFNETTVSLLPGNYEIVGRRRGYEDVKEYVRVRAGEEIPPITVIATTRMAL